MTWPEIFNYGVPTAILAAVAFGIYKLVMWAKEEIVKPVARSHIELIEALKGHMPKQADAVNKMLENQAAIIELLRNKKE